MKKPVNDRILVSIQPLRAIDLNSGQYVGYAFLNLVKSNKKHYLNLILKTKYKDRGKWRGSDVYAIRIPIPSLAMMYHYIKKNIGIIYSSNKSWKFIENGKNKTKE